MIFPSRILLIVSIDSTLKITTLRIGANQIVELEWVLGLEEAKLACQSQQYAAYVVEYAWLGKFLAEMAIAHPDHPPVIALVDSPEVGEKALELGAADYLESSMFTSAESPQYGSATLERSLRLTITAHQRFLALKESQEKFSQQTENIDLITEATRQNETKYRDLFNLMPGGVVFVFDREMRISLARGKALNTFYLSSDNLEGSLLQDVLSSEDFALIEPHYQAVLTGASPIFEFNYENCCYLVNTSPIKDEAGNISGGIAVAYDITERKYIEQALKYSEARFRAIFERSPMGVALVSIERKIFQVNPTFCAILGYDETDLIGVSARDITHPEDLEVTDGNINYLLNREINYFTLEKRYLCKDGSYSWVQSAVAAVKDSQNALQYMILLIVDIQPHKQTEERIEYRLHLESIVTTISQHLLTSEAVNLDWIMEILGKAVECDRSFINQFTDDLACFSIAHEWCSENTFSITDIRQNIATNTYENWLNLLRDNQDIVINDTQEVPPGAERDCHDETCSAARLEVPIFNAQSKLWISLCFESVAPRSWFPEDAQILRLIGEMICSYYERVQSQRKLKTSEALYESIFNHTPDNIFLFQVHYPLDTEDTQNIRFTYETINPASEKAGISKEEIMGKMPREIEIFSPEVAVWVEQHYLACVQGGEVMTYEEKMVVKGKDTYYITTLVPIRDEVTGQIIKIQGSARDITEMKITEQEKFRQDRYQKLLFSLTLKIRESLELSEILKMTVDELQKALKIDRIVIWQFNSDRTIKVAGEAFADGLEKINTTFWNPEPMPQEKLQQLRQGIAMQAVDLKDLELFPSYRDTLQHSEIKSRLKLPILLKSDRGGNSRDRPSQPSEDLWGFLSLYDCQKTRTWEKWEVEQLQQMANQLGIAIYQAQLLHQERRNARELAAYNAELSEFAYIASHDLQTPLGTISNYGYLLQNRYGEQLDTTGTKFLQFMVSGAQRMRALIDDLSFYNLFNRDKPTLSPTDCNLVLQEAYSNLEAEMISAQAIIKCVTLPTVLGSHFQLVHLFQNLLSNSLKYRGSEIPIIEIDVILQGDKWLFSFRDNGIGLDNQYRDRIFQIFQRLHTQQKYSGTGIGLAICKKVVEFHGGHIWVESSPKKGATFYFTLNSSPSFI